MKVESSFGSRNFGYMVGTWIVCLFLAFGTQTPSAFMYKQMLICWIVAAGWSVVAYLLESAGFYYYQKWFYTACDLSVPVILDTSKLVQTLAGFFPWAEIGVLSFSLVFASFLLGGAQSVLVMFLTRTTWWFGCIAVSNSIYNTQAALTVLRKYPMLILSCEAEMVAEAQKQAQAKE